MSESTQDGYSIGESVIAEHWTGFDVEAKIICIYADCAWLECFDGEQGVMLTRYVKELRKTPKFSRVRPCGCVTCICEDEARCQGCGAKSCGKHPVGEIPNPVFDDE